MDGRMSGMGEGGSFFILILLGIWVYNILFKK